MNDVVQVILKPRRKLNLLTFASVRFCFCFPSADQREGSLQWDHFRIAFIHDVRRLTSRRKVVFEARDSRRKSNFEKFHLRVISRPVGTEFGNFLSLAAHEASACMKEAICHTRVSVLKQECERICHMCVLRVKDGMRAKCLLGVILS